MNLVRSLLFIPGNRPTMLEKGAGIAADVLVLDLEDSVPPEEKTRARGIVVEYAAKLKAKPIFIRVNAMGTEWVEDDLKAVIQPGIEGISIGKMESARMARELDRLISDLERQRGIPSGAIKIIPWIETARGVSSAREIGESTPRMFGLAFGAEDFTADMGISRTEQGQEVEAPRAFTAIAARAAGILALDTPETDFKDIEGLVRDAQHAKALGYKGKFAIHPAQVQPINDVFQPTGAEIEHAHRVIEVFEEARRQGRASVALDGKMVDVPIWKRALKVLEAAEAIQKAAR